MTALLSAFCYGRILAGLVHGGRESVLGDRSGDALLHERSQECANKATIFADFFELPDHDGEDTQDCGRRNKIWIHRGTAQAETVSRRSYVRQQILRLHGIVQIPVFVHSRASTGRG